MKKFLLFLALLISFHADAAFGVRVKNLKATQLSNGDVRFYIELYDSYEFDRRLDSIKVRNDTVELYFCFEITPFPSIHSEFYVKDFTPHVNYTSYKGKIFLQRESTNNCDYLDNSAITTSFTLSLPLSDTAYILDIPKVATKEETALYPNPTTGSVSIPGNLKYEMLTVTNTFGQTVLEAKKQSTFSLASLPAGLYFVRFLDKQGVHVGNSRILKE